MSSSHGSVVRRDYAAAIGKLNSFQSNAATLKKTVATRPTERLLVASRQLPEMRQYLSGMGHDVKDFDALNLIHISGTKGKGSTCSFVENILRGYGYRTGLFSSPHLMEARERIRISGRPLSQEKFAGYFWECYDLLCASGFGEQPDKPPFPAYFRFLTLMSLHVFRKEKIEAAIMEVGIGGMYDSTNVINKPIVCGTSALGLDHTALLGNTLEEIALQKAGIYKSGVPAVTVTQPTVACEEVMKKHSDEVGAPLFVCRSGKHEFEEYMGGNRIKLGLSGEHQKENAILAMHLCNIWLSVVDPQKAPFFLNRSFFEAAETSAKGITSLSSFVAPRSMLNSLSKSSWPGRCQKIELGNSVRVFADGAHTAESMKVCSEWLEDELAKADGCYNILIFNCSPDRDPRRLLEHFVSKRIPIQRGVFCPNIISRSVNGSSDSKNFTVDDDSAMKHVRVCRDSWGALKDVQSYIFSSIEEAVEHALKIDCDGKPKNIIVTGSLHLVGGAMQCLGVEVS
eukprot:Nk52_evm23s211 gene=Nk52_evmTU23s211